MLDNQKLISSSDAGFVGPATWVSAPIDLGMSESTGVSFHIMWRDFACTFNVQVSNVQVGTPTSPVTYPWVDITADIRLVDPTWVDPVLADPYTPHIVSTIHTNTRFIAIGFSGGNWTGAVGPFLKIVSNVCKTRTR